RRSAVGGYQLSTADGQASTAQCKAPAAYVPPFATVEHRPLTDGTTNNRRRLPFAVCRLPGAATGDIDDPSSQPTNDAHRARSRVGANRRSPKR
ncbi:hypothetical protein, partial [Burkholderia pseudomallei]|uniref:hypothetical protein n=3 Tax=Burkholderia pseudomallei TaxID=28450 RepID=UPI001C4A944F